MAKKTQAPKTKQTVKTPKRSGSGGWRKSVKAMEIPPKSKTTNTKKK